MSTVVGTINVLLKISFLQTLSAASLVLKQCSCAFQGVLYFTFRALDRTGPGQWRFDWQSRLQCVRSRRDMQRAMQSFRYSGWISLATFCSVVRVVCTAIIASASLLLGLTMLTFKLESNNAGLSAYYITISLDVSVLPVLEPRLFSSRDHALVAVLLSLTFVCSVPIDGSYMRVAVRTVRWGSSSDGIKVSLRVLKSDQKTWWSQGGRLIYEDSWLAQF